MYSKASIKYKRIARVQLGIYSGANRNKGFAAKTNDWPDYFRRDKIPTLLKFI